jgi:Homeodomain-like domain
MKPGATEFATLEPQKWRAVELLLEGRSHEEIATELGVTRVTVWRWTGEPEVAGTLLRARSERLEAVQGRLDALVGSALNVIAGVLDDEAAPVAIRLKAASEVLQRAGYAPGEAAQRRGKALAESLVFGLTSALQSRLPGEAMDQVLQVLEETILEPQPLEDETILKIRYSKNKEGAR